MKRQSATLVLAVALIQLVALPVRAAVQPLEVKLVSRPSPVIAGALATLTIQTTAGATCRLRVQYGSSSSGARGARAEGGR